MTKAELRDYIIRQLGSPYIKVELSNDQLNDAINRATAMHNKWAVGNSIREVFFTMPLSAGERYYNLPDGVSEVITMDDSTDNMGSANQLFTTSNYMLNAGMLNFLQGRQTYSMVSYQLGLQYLDLLDKYSVSAFSWQYHKYNNTLTLSPVPSAADSWDTSSTNFMLIHSYMKEGYGLDGVDESDAYNEYIYEEPWIQEYCIALAKMTLGHTRRKFSNGAIMGNSTLQLDGSDLMQEGKEEKEALEEKLKSEEVNDGWPIVI